MPSAQVPQQSRRSTRVPMKVAIEAKGATETLTHGETIVVNLHGALISTDFPLRTGMKIQIHVFMTNTRAAVDVDRPRVCGIGLVIPENIWGVERPPDDWG